MNPGARRLAERIRDEIPLLERSVIEALEDWRGFREHSGTAYLKAVAIDLHSFYSGLEALFLRIAREIDEDEPAGETWHIALLLQMAQAMPPKRPAVIGQESLQALDELRGFRHRIRNIYVFNLDARRMADMLASLPPLWQVLSAELATFADLLAGT